MIFYELSESDVCYLLLIYKKGRKDSLSKEQRNQLKAYAQKLKEEVRRHGR